MKTLLKATKFLLVFLAAALFLFGQTSDATVAPAIPSGWTTVPGGGVATPGPVSVEGNVKAGSYAINDGGAAERIPVTDAAGNFVWTDLPTLLQSAAYGVSWNSNTDTYTRVGTTASVPVGTDPASSLIPVEANMRRCVVNNAGQVVYYLDSTNSNYKADGTAANLTGADGQVMVQIPAFYERFTYVAPVYTWEISTAPLPGFTLDPAFIKDGVQVPYRYIGAYEGVLYDTSAGQYTDGFYQPAFSCTFSSTGNTVSTTAMTGPFALLTAGDKITISGTTADNGTFTVASIVSPTSFTTVEPLVSETDASTVIQYQVDWTAGTGDVLSSVAGHSPAIEGTRAQFRQAAFNRGPGWRDEDYDLYSAVQLLYLVEYASFNSQAMIGPGITNVTDWTAYNNQNPIAPTGNSDGIGNATGNTAGSTASATEMTMYMSYRGIEDWYGHIWTFVDGVNIGNYIPYVSNTASNWADDTSTNYTSLGITLPNSDGWQSTLAEISRGFLPLTVGASSSTKITDYYYNPASTGWRVVIAGGSANYGAAAGAFDMNANNSSGAAYRNFGDRLCY